MDYIEITKEMLMEANDYVANAAKEAWAGENAPKCFDRLAITADNEPMPPMYMINAGLKARYLMALFAGAYMRQKYEADEKDPAMMTDAEYDRWAGSHVFGQIDRWKHDAEVRNKCYDLMADFKDVEKRFSSQLNGLLAVQNDSVLRQSQYMTTQMSELPKVIEQLKELQEERENGKQTPADK